MKSALKTKKGPTCYHDISPATCNNEEIYNK